MIYTILMVREGKRKTMNGLGPPLAQQITTTVTAWIKIPKKLGDCGDCKHKDESFIEPGD
jgi:hypothetical protein